MFIKILNLKHQIEEIFHQRIQPDKFHKYLNEPVDTWIAGEGHELSGHHKTIEEFHRNIFDRLAQLADLSTLKIEVKRVIGGGESAVRLTFLNTPRDWRVAVMLLRSL